MSSAVEPAATGSLVCVVIGRTRHKMMLVELQEAGKRGARLIELRLDFLARSPDLTRLLSVKPCPMIATVRRAEDGGRWSGTEESRQALLRQAIAAGFDWVDLETDIADDIRRFRNVKRIISYHNLRGIPDDIEEIYKRMCAQDGDIVKIAVTAHSPTDNLRILNMFQAPPRPTVALCMGEVGIPSRILSARQAQPWTYAAFNKERGIAPGILSSEEVTHLYRYEQITPETPIYGIIGDPVAHSLSPLIHNRTLQHLGMPGVYLPFRVPRGELPPFLKGFEQLKVSGYSVTIPHKETAAKLATHADETVKRTGAANTLVRQETGWRAYNTDMIAALESLRANLPPLADGTPGTLEGKVVLLLGAGGVARALAFGLQKAGALVTIVNRTPERAQKLAEAVGCRTVEWAARHATLAELVINCTSVGMFPNVDESPMHSSYFKPGVMVFDTIYTPETTLLIKEARDRGSHVLPGVDMFVRQAALQFNLFTGRAAPLAFMDKVVRRALSPIHLHEEE